MAINPASYSPPPVLTYQGEGETDFSTPSQAPAVVSAHEAVNLQSFERHAAAIGGTVVDEHIVLKYGFDPTTGRFEVVGGESKATIKVGNTSSSPDQANGSQSTDTSSDTPPDSSSDTSSPTTQQSVLQQLQSMADGITQKIQSLDNGQKPQGLNPNQSRQDLQNELDKVQRVITKLQNQKIFDQLLKTQGVITSAIDKNSAAAEKIMKAIRGGNSNGNSTSPQFPSAKVYTNSTTPVIGLLLNAFA